MVSRYRLKLSSTNLLEQKWKGPRNIAAAELVGWGSSLPEQKKLTLLARKANEAKVVHSTLAVDGSVGLSTSVTAAPEGKTRMKCQFAGFLGVHRHAPPPPPQQANYCWSLGR